MNLADLHRASALASRIVHRVANAPEWGAARRSRESVQALMDAEPNLKDMLACEERYNALYSERRTSPVTKP